MFNISYFLSCLLKISVSEWPVTRFQAGHSLTSRSLAPATLSSRSLAFESITRFRADHSLSSRSLAFEPVTRKRKSAVADHFQSDVSANFTFQVSSFSWKTATAYLRALCDALFRALIQQNWPWDRKFTRSCWCLHWFLGLRSNVLKILLQVLLYNSEQRKCSTVI